MVQIGIIGVGGIARAHLGAYQRLESARVVALCDRIPERASGRAQEIAINFAAGGGTAVQARSYTHYRDLLADPEVEAVDICLPSDLHAEVAVAALEAGKHVLTEKPMALTVADCDRMIAAARASGRILMVAHCIRFWGAYLYLKEAVDSGRYGKLTSAWFSRLSAFPQWSSENWLADPARSGGSLFDLHVHDADFIAFLLGLPREVSARGVEDEHGISYVMTDYRYEPGQTVFAEGGWYFHPGVAFRMPFLARLEGATIECDDLRGPLTVFPAEGEPFQPDLPAGDAYTHEIAYFLDCVRQGRLPKVVTPWEARETIRLLHAEAESLRSGRPVTL